MQALNYVTPGTFFVQLHVYLKVQLHMMEPGLKRIHLF